MGIPMDLLNLYLFIVEMVSKWSKDIVSMLTLGTLHLSSLKDANLAFIETSQHYSMVSRWVGSNPKIVH